MSWSTPVSTTGVDPPGLGNNDIGRNDAFTLLLVTGFTGQVATDLDINNDGVLDENDYVEVNGENYASGILFDTDDLDGTLVDPSVLIGTGESDFLFLSGGDDQLTLRVGGTESSKTGRLSWRELDVQL